MNNPTALKIYNVVLIIALFTSLGFLVHALWQNLQWKMQVETLAGYEGATRARHDFQAGRLRLFMIVGERSDDKFSGTNDGPFEVWYPQYFPEYYPFRYATTVMVTNYNERMRFLREHPDKSLETTNRRPNTALEPTPTAP
jgi:hypothetical protein